MLKLKKFYDLIHKSMDVTLCDGLTGKIFYRGPLKDIPDEYNGRKVFDFFMNDDGITFDIEEEAEHHE